MNSIPSASPHPDRAVPSVPEHDALTPGTRFGEFEILRVLGVGGFGIVYLAMDHSLQREVALKEYMPAALAARGAGPQITVRSGSFSETYAIGLRSFINEARLLAKFDHPSLVKVYRFWEDNATAYMVMPYLQGRTLRESRRDMGATPDETWLRALLDPLLGAIEVLHREGVYHRDIAPDNILLLTGSPPVLLDFGAARRVISDRTQTLTAILKPNYAPIEQYAEMTLLRQGPWTDIYAMGAVLHFALLGTPPPPATSRALEDELVPLAPREFAGVSQRFLLAVDWALAVRPGERPQSVDALRAALDGRADVPAAVEQRSARSARLPPSGSAYDTTLILDGAATQPAPVAYAPTLPMQPTVPMQRTELLQSTFPMQRTEPAQRTEPMQWVDPVRRAEPMQATQPQRGVPTALAAPDFVVPPGAARDVREDAVASIEEAFPEGDGHSRGSRRAGVLAAVISTVVVAAGVGWIFGASQPAPKTSATQAAPAAKLPPAGATAPVTKPAVPSVALPAAAGAASTAPPAVEGAAAPRAAAPAPAVTVPPAAVVAKPTTVVVPQPRRATPAERAVAPAAAPRPEATQAKTLAPAANAANVTPPPIPPAPAVAAALVPPAAAPAAAVPDEPKTAREACGKRVLIALWTCMERECEKPRYREHPQCVEALSAKRARDRG